MSTENHPGGLPPDDQHGDVRATAQTEHDLAVERLRALSDDDLAAFSKTLDDVLAGVRSSPAVCGIEDVVDLAACARILLRRRRQAAACGRARAMVQNLVSAEASE